MTDVAELGDRCQDIRKEMARLNRWPLQILRMSQEGRGKRLADLQAELSGLETQMQRERDARQLAGIESYFGARQVSEDAVSELPKLEKEADKALKDAEATLRGVAERVHRTQRALFEARSRAGEARAADWPNMINPLGRKLAALAEQAVIYRGGSR